MQFLFVKSRVSSPTKVANSRVSTGRILDSRLSESDSKGIKSYTKVDMDPISAKFPNSGTGSVKINHFLYFFLTLQLLTPAYTYYMATYTEQCPPFPHATVTKTACHYPQAQFFRWTMLTAASFLTLIFHAVFRWF